LLVMSATTSLQTMQDVIQAHSQGRNGGIKACVITKVDEAMSLAPSVDCLIRHDLPLLFIGNGQQVPEDLHVAIPIILRTDHFSRVRCRLISSPTMRWCLR